MIHCNAIIVLCVVCTEISMKRASAFGSEKVVSSPPFCMFTIIDKDTVPDFSKVLIYPLTLKDCVTVDDHNEPVINIVIAITKGIVRNIYFSVLFLV